MLALPLLVGRVDAGLARRIIVVLRSSSVRAPSKRRMSVDLRCPRSGTLVVARVVLLECAGRGVGADSLGVRVEGSGPFVLVCLQGTPSSRPKVGGGSRATTGPLGK